MSKNKIIFYDSKDKSSFIQRAVWSRDHQVMVLNFKTKAVWAYADVSEDLFIKFITSDSLGSYFNKNIRNQLTGTQLTHVSNDGTVTKLMDAPFDV